MSQDIAVSEIRRRILRYWWIPVLCALIGTAVGLAAPKNSSVAPWRNMASAKK